MQKLHHRLFKLKSGKDSNLVHSLGCLRGNREKRRTYLTFNYTHLFLSSLQATVLYLWQFEVTFESFPATNLYIYVNLWLHVSYARLKIVDKQR